MKKGTRVSWQIGTCARGHGKVVSDEQDGQVLVAVDSFAGEPNPGYHPVINCTVTWLTPEPDLAHEGDAQIAAALGIKEEAPAARNDEPGTRTLQS